MDDDQYVPLDDDEDIAMDAEHDNWIVEDVPGHMDDPPERERGRGRDRFVKEMGEFRLAFPDGEFHFFNIHL